jgi:hypothetical protein
MMRGERGSHLATCAIATCPPSELMATIHDRMPVILPPVRVIGGPIRRRARPNFVGRSYRFVCVSNRRASSS